MRKDGEKYTPSNGTEGMSFEEDHCYQCINCDPNPSGKKQCNIWFNAINSWPQGIPVTSIPTLSNRITLWKSISSY